MDCLLLFVRCSYGTCNGASSLTWLPHDLRRVLAAGGAGAIALQTIPRYLCAKVGNASVEYAGSCYSWLTMARQEVAANHEI